MKLTYIILCAFFLFSYNLQANSVSPFSRKKNYNQNDSSNIYRIIKIDSIGRIYVFLAQKNKLIYKIISFKDSLNCINRIKLGNLYNMELKSVFSNNFQKGDIHFVRYGSVHIPLGGGEGVIWDLFSVQNLKDLCSIADGSALRVPSRRENAAQGKRVSVGKKALQTRKKRRFPSEKRPVIHRQN